MHAGLHAWCQGLFRRDPVAGHTAAGKQIARKSPRDCCWRVNPDLGTCQLLGCLQPLLLLQVFGCVDWAPSDLVTSFLLAGAAQTARRRAQVIAIMAAGGAGSVPSVGRKSQGAACVCRVADAPRMAVCMAVEIESMEAVYWP